MPPRRPLGDLLYELPSPVALDELAVSASAWLDAVHVFGVDALAAGVGTSEVLAATVQLLEGWMLAHDPPALATTWTALDATITLLQRRLAETREERDRLAAMTEALLREGRRRNRRRGGRKKKPGKG